MVEEHTDRPTVEQMRQLYIDGVIGTKELRAWLSKKDEDFANVRDPHVDNMIDDIARKREEAIDAWRREAEEKDRERPTTGNFSSGA